MLLNYGRGPWNPDASTVAEREVNQIRRQGEEAVGIALMTADWCECEVDLQHSSHTTATKRCRWATELRSYCELARVNQEARF